MLLGYMRLSIIPMKWLKIVRTPQSLSKALALLRERNGNIEFSLFRGILTEWLVCAEYNALKNKGSVVMTIVNPAPSSKADLLHILDKEKTLKNSVKS